MAVKPTLLLIAVPLLAQVDPQGWNNARWGMTQAQLVSRAGARHVPLETRGSRKTQLGLDFDLDSLRFRAFLFVDEAFGLEMVVLKALDSDPLVLASFYNIEKDLTAKYGPPQKRSIDQSKGIVATARWVLGTTAIELSFTNVNGGYRDPQGRWRSIPAKGLDITYTKIGANKL